MKNNNFTIERTIYYTDYNVVLDIFPEIERNIRFELLTQLNDIIENKIAQIQFVNVINVYSDNVNINITLFYEVEG